MDDVDIGALIGCVIELSEADDWEHARREWEVTSCYDDPDHAKTCVCGKEGLRYFRVGEGKLRRLAEQVPTPEWVIVNGNRVQIKRKKFEQFIDAIDVI